MEKTNVKAETLRENFRTAGKITSIDAMRSYDEEAVSGTEVMNATMQVEAVEDVGGIKIPIMKESRITFFHTMAVKASQELEVGDHVLLTDCIEQIRPYTKKTGEVRKMLGTTANQMVKISQDVYDQVKAVLAAEAAAPAKKADFTR